MLSFSLSYGQSITDLSTILSSSPSLEELELYEKLEERAVVDLCQWLINTHAAHLRKLTIYHPLDGKLREALTSPGVVPSLEVLNVHIIGRPSFVRFIDAIQRGAWPSLQGLGLDLENVSTVTINRLMDALSSPGGVPAFKDLELSHADSGHLTAVFDKLCSGACPRLQGLHLSYSWNRRVDTVVVVDKLTRVLQAPTACSSSLKRLVVDNCRLSSDATKQLAMALAQPTACPSLEELHLCETADHRSDGIQSLVQAMRQGGGAFTTLKILVLERFFMEKDDALALSRALQGTFF